MKWTQRGQKLFCTLKAIYFLITKISWINMYKLKSNLLLPTSLSIIVAQYKYAINSKASLIWSLLGRIMKDFWFALTRHGEQLFSKMWILIWALFADGYFGFFLCFSFLLLLLSWDEQSQFFSHVFTVLHFTFSPLGL